MVLSLVDTRHDQVGDIGTSSGTRSQHCTLVDHQIIGCGLMLTVSDKIRWFRRNKLLPHFPHSATLPELGRHHWHHEQEDAATNNGTWTPAAVQAAAWGQRPHTRLSRATAQGFARRGHCCHSHSWGRDCNASSRDRVTCSDGGRLDSVLHWIPWITCTGVRFSLRWDVGRCRHQPTARTRVHVTHGLRRRRGAACCWINGV